MNIFYGDGWDKRVDKDVAQFVLEKWGESIVPAYRFVRLKSDEERAAYFEKMEKELWKDLGFESE